MFPAGNFYMPNDRLPNAMLSIYADAGRGSLFQFHNSFVRQAALLLDSEEITSRQKNS
jgi:hypothetical protein